MINTKKIPFLLIILFLFAGCNNKPTSENAAFNPMAFEQEVINANNGDIRAIDSLSGLFDKELPPPHNYNNLIIDSIKTGENKTYYFLLVEYPNPIYNRFAVYDSTLELYLMDKSLNGYLSYKIIKKDTLNFVEVTEDFITKDTIKLSRKNLYSFDNNTVHLAFKSFSGYSFNKITLTQQIESITPQIINTNFISPPKFPLENKWDTFNYNKKTKFYKSDSNYFDSLIYKLVKSNTKPSKKPFFEDKISAIKSTGMKVSIDSVNRYNNFRNTKDRFTINLTEGWRAIKDMVITKQINTQLRGTSFINPSLGASFNVAKIGENEKAEDFISYPMTHVLKGNYIVRFSDKISLDKSYFQFFEISCVNLKYLIIFECPIISYETNKQIFEDIISSFGIQC